MTSLKQWANARIPELVVIGLAAGVLAAYLSGALAYSGILPCAVSPWVIADGRATSRTLTWSDANGNGTQDSGELPLAWVTVGFERGEPAMTGADGQGTAGLFKPGCACYCWRDERVEVLTPPGYRATTPTRLDTTGEEARYAFGFQRQVDEGRPEFPGEPDWFNAFINRHVALTDFAYAADQQAVRITLDTSEETELETAYHGIFRTIDALADEGIGVQQVHLTTTVPEETAVCDLDTVREWAGRITYAEIVATYCEHPDASGGTEKRV